MRYTKFPLNHQQIIQILKQRGLTFADFKQRLKALLNAYPNVDVAAMGFPSTWKEEALWSE